MTKQTLYHPMTHITVLHGSCDSHMSFPFGEPVRSPDYWECHCLNDEIKHRSTKICCYCDAKEETSPRACVADVLLMIMSKCKRSTK